MERLTTYQVDQIRQEVARQEIYVGHLFQELTDHLCCATEDWLRQGLSFEEAVNRVYQEVGLSGLQQIQKDTLYLTDNNYRLMKNSMKMTGTAGMVLLAFGALFKIQHLPGANIMMILGFIILGAIFFPVSLLVMRKETKQLSKPVVYLSAMIGSLSIIFGIQLKVLHWPGFYVLILVGYALLCLVFIPLFLSELLKTTKDNALKNSYIVGAVALFLCLAGSCFKFNHYPGSLPILAAGSLLLSGIFFPMYVFSAFKGMKKVEPRFIFLCIGLVYFNMFNLLLAYH